MNSIATETQTNAANSLKAKRRYLLALISGSAVAGLTASMALGATSGTWTGAASSGTINSWFNAANWNGSVPSYGIATFNAGSTNGTTPGTPIVLDTSGVTLQQLFFDYNAYSGVNGYTLGTTSGNAITFGNNGYLFINTTFAGTGITQTVAAPILVGFPLNIGNWTPTSANNLLSLQGTIANVNTGGNDTVSLVGIGNGTISGNIINNGSGGSLTLGLHGIGTWTLSGTNTYTGSTQIQGGTLVLDDSMNNTNKISGALTLGGFEGGTLQLNGNASAASTQTETTALISTGASNIMVNAGSGQNATLVLGTGSNLLGASVGGTVNFVLNNNGSGVAAATVRTLNTAGIIGGWATVNGTDWATNATDVAGGSITAYTSYTNDTWASADNTTVTALTNTITAGSTTNSLRFNANQASTVNLAGAGTITSGGILVTPNVGANNTTITGGTLTGSSYELIINQNNTGGNLTINSQITGNKSLTKSGLGTLVLTGTNNFTGTVYVNQGRLQLGGGDTTALGAVTNNIELGNAGATLDLNGNNITVNDVNSDAYSLSGTQAAINGYTSEITNSKAGTDAVLTVNSANNNNSAFYGGLVEGNGAIISLDVSNKTLTIGAIPLGTSGNYGQGNNYVAYNNNIISGSITVGTGSSASTPTAILQLAGYAGLFTTGAVTINGNGGVTTTGAQAPTMAAGYLTGVNPLVMSGSSGAGIFVLNSAGSVTDVFAGGVTGPVQFSNNGPGTVDVSSQTINSSALQSQYGTGTLILSAVIGTAGNGNPDVGIVGTGTIKVIGGSTSTQSTPAMVLGGDSTSLNGGTLLIAPGGSGGNVFVTGGNVNLDSNVFANAGSGTLALNRGANTTLTLTLGSTSNVHNSMFTRQNLGTLVMAPSDGLAGLGSTESVNVLGSSTVVRPQTINGIVAPWLIGQDTNGNGSFLTYVGTGTTGANTDPGFENATYTDTNFASPANTKIELVTANTNLTANKVAYAMRVDASTLTLGSTDTVTLGGGYDAGLILNGGTITGGNLSAIIGNSYYGFDIYTSSSNGTIASNISINSYHQLITFGPGTLYLTGNQGYTGQTRIESGALDVTGTALNANSVLQLRGGVLEANGSFTRTLGTAAGDVNWVNGGDLGPGGGFAAAGGALTVAISNGNSGLAQLAWGNTLTDGSVLMFGALTANNAVNFENSIDLGAPNGTFAYNNVNADYWRSIAVMASAADITNHADPLSVVDSTTISGTISSSFAFHGLDKSGTGVLYLTGANTYSGATSISGGALVIGSDANLGTAPTAAYALNTAPGLSGGAATPGSVIINGGTTLAADATFALNSSRTILLASGTGITASNIEVAASQALTFDGQIANYINETGALNKTGAGELVYGGVSSYTGNTEVVTGSLDVNGNIASSPTVTVDGGATLGGSGTLAALVANNGSTIHPGDLNTANVQSLTVSSVTVDPASFDFSLDPLGNASEILDTGTFTQTGIGTNTVNVAAIGSSLDYTTYTLISALGGGLNLSDFAFSNSLTTESLLVGATTYNLTLGVTGVGGTALVLTVNSPNVPEPAALAMLAVGGAGILLGKRRRKV